MASGLEAVCSDMLKPREPGPYVPEEIVQKQCLCMGLNSHCENKSQLVIDYNSCASTWCKIWWGCRRGQGHEHGLASGPGCMGT